MTRQTWTALVAAVVFVGLSVVLAVVPVPYVVWTPGGTRDTLGSLDGRPVVAVTGAPTYPTSGALDLTVITVTAVDSRLTLPQAVVAHFAPDRDVLPRDAVYPPDQPAADVEREEAQLMDAAQDDAVVAALRAAGQPVTELPVVSSVTSGGPADGRLKPGDLVVSVEGAATADPSRVAELVQSRPVGSPVDFVVLRDRVRTPVRVTTARSPTQADVAAVGVGLAVGYRYAPQVSYDLGRQIGGPSAGLVFALAIYDKLTPGALLADRHVAGTGTIAPTGQVGAIGGVRQKLAAAEDAGAGVFVVPAANCGDLAGVDTDLQVVAVETLTQAVDALGQPGGRPC